MSSPSGWLDSVRRRLAEDERRARQDEAASRVRAEAAKRPALRHELWRILAQATAIVDKITAIEEMVDFFNQEAKVNDRLKLVIPPDGGHVDACMAAFPDLAPTASRVARERLPDRPAAGERMPLRLANAEAGDAQAKALVFDDIRTRVLDGLQRVTLRDAPTARLSRHGIVSEHAATASEGVRHKPGTWVDPHSIVIQRKDW